MNTYAEQQICLKFCVANKIPCEKASNMLQKSYGETALSKAEVYDSYNAMKTEKQLPSSSSRIQCISPVLEMPSIIYSDSENEYHNESVKGNRSVRRQVGRPSTGAINLNIVRTGRGQGRPSKVSNGQKHALAVETASIQTKKRGRPSKGGVSYTPTGKARGRPKATNLTDNEQVKSKDDNEEVLEGEKGLTIVETHNVPKNRGRPKNEQVKSKGDNEEVLEGEKGLTIVETHNVPKNRGRPKNDGKKVSFPKQINESNIGKNLSGNENELDKDWHLEDNIIEAKVKEPKKTRGRPSKIKNSSLKKGKARGRPKLIRGAVESVDSNAT